MIKKEYNEVKIPENLDLFIDEVIEKEHKKKRKLWLKKSISIITAGVICIILIGVIKPFDVNATPALQLIIQKLHERRNNGGKGVNYVTEYNQRVKDNGVEVILTKTEYDGNNLYVFYKVKSDSPFISNNDDISREQLLYEGHGMVSFTNKELDNSGMAGLEGKFIDDYTFEGVERYALKSLEEDIPKEFEFKILINLFRCIPIQGDDRANLMRVGDWGFKIKVNTEDNIGNKILVNDVDKAGFGIKELTISPYEISIITEHKPGIEFLYYNVGITDENGKDMDMVSQSWQDTTSEIIFDGKQFMGKKAYITLYKYKAENALSRGEVLYTKEINLD